MIKIKKITVKNLMSVGNSPLELELDTHKTNLITGKNGSGKSTLLIEAITFGLYGKPYRNINKPQLVNSFNKKGLLVIIEFDVDGVLYTVRRGAGPKVFEVFKDGTLIPEDASIGDYQDYLENSILGVSYKAFKQIVVLGTAGYVPFMQLTPAQRRDVVENLLNIGIISSMVSLNKERTGAVQSEIDRVEHNIELLTQKRVMVQKMQDENSNAIAGQIDEQNELIQRLQGQLHTASESVSNVELMVTKLKGAVSNGVYTEALPSLYTACGQLQHRISENKKLIDFLKHNENCPVCTQKIDSNFKDSKSFSLDMENDDLGMKLTAQKEQVESNEKLKARDQQIQVKLAELTRQLSVEEANIQHYTASIAAANAKLDQLRSKTVTDLTDQLKKLDAKINELNEQRLDLKNDKYCHAVIASILKDSGVKTVIINQYIPVINKLISDYLIKMGATYTFEIDSEFNESVKTRGMENFTYNSFSEGQKFRIDLAFLFAWRDLIKMISGGDFNVLIMDEIMDSASDLDGVICLVDILNSLKDKIYIISHNEKLDVMEFDRLIEVKMVGRFSEIEITE